MHPLRGPRCLGLRGSGAKGSLGGFGFRVWGLLDLRGLMASGSKVF